MRRHGRGSKRRMLAQPLAQPSNCRPRCRDAADDVRPAEATPPLDEDSEERAAIADEFQAITDRAPLAKEDMFAYWRLLRWTESAKLPACSSGLGPTSGTAT